MGYTAICYEADTDTQYPEVKYHDDPAFNGDPKRHSIAMGSQKRVYCDREYLYRLYYQLAHFLAATPPTLAELKREKLEQEAREDEAACSECGDVNGCAADADAGGLCEVCADGKAA